MCLFPEEVGQILERIVEACQLASQIGMEGVTRVGLIRVQQHIAHLFAQVFLEEPKDAEILAKKI